MGRPLNKKYFGNTNIATTGEGVGGEGVATVTIAAPIAASMNTGATAVFSAPQIPGGETATGTVTIDGAGDIVAVVITNAGSGYTSLPTITITDTVAGGGESTTLTSGVGGVTVTLTSGASARQNAITISAYIPAANGGLGAKTGDILKQVSTNRYRVRTADGTGICKLVAAAPGAGELTMTATDSAGGTYYVTKLTSRKALLIKGNRTGTQFTSGTMVAWSFGSAVLNTSVQISNQ